MLEEKIKELEEIVEKMDRGTTVEEGIALFEKGVALTKECLGYLDTQKGKITEIKEEMDKLIERPIDDNE